MFEQPLIAVAGAGGDLGNLVLSMVDAFELAGQTSEPVAQSRIFRSVSLLVKRAR